jgi:hypothetical protein
MACFGGLQPIVASLAFFYVLVESVHAYCMAILLICLNVFLIFKARSLSFIPKFFIDGMCGCYFVFFLLRVCAANLSLQYVNNVNCMMSYGVGAYDRGGGWLYRWRHMYNHTPYVHGSCHIATVFS